MTVRERRTAASPTPHGKRLSLTRALSPRAQAGNILFMLLIAVALIAALTYAISNSSRGGANLDRENNSLAVDKTAGFGMDLKRAVDTMQRAGISETAIRFASSGLTGYGTPDAAPAAEVFNISGGGVALPDVPKGANDASQWEFMADTRAPNVGEDANPDLLLVLPRVTASFCRAYNKKAGYADTDPIPTDSGACVFDPSKRFSGSFPDSSSANSMDAATFKKPAPFACVACAGPVYHAYYVLIER